MTPRPSGSLFKPALVIVAVKLYTFVVSFLSSNRLDPLSIESLRPSKFVTAWSHWDVLRYNTIATQWYNTRIEPENIVFYPLFPFLTRCVSLVRGDVPIVSFVLANVFSFAGLLVFYRLVQMDETEDIAFASVAAMALFPTAFFFQTGYTEGLFLLTSVGSWWAARRGQWPAAGILGGLAAFTRVTGLLLFPALIIELWIQRKQIEWKAACWLLAIPSALAIYLSINLHVFGDPFTFSKYMATMWHKRLDFPWDGLMRSVYALKIVSGARVWHEASELAAAAVLVFASVCSFKFLRPSYAVYLTLITLLVLSTSFIQSTPRYALTAFPLFILIGRLMHPWSRLFSYLLVSLACLTFLTVAFVNARWAF